ncbi:hypothetical protein D3C78_1174720 [compost metagenome]
MLLRKHIQQRGVSFADVHVQTHAVHLPKRHALQTLVEHPNTVLLALDRFPDNIRHAARADRQLLFTRRQLFGQTTQLDLHLLDSFNRIVRADNILTNTLTQVLIHRHKELNFAFRTFWIFRHTQHIAQMLVVRHRWAQRTQCLIRHGTQLITGKIG